MMNQMEVDLPTVKTEAEIDELEDDDYQESDIEGDTEVYDTPLQKPAVQMLTTQRLHAMIHDGDINLDAEYQRDVVWPDVKKIALIDSVFRNYFIPPVIFAVQRDADGVEVRVCVDGKQRLTSIQRFLDGQIPHMDTRFKKKYWFQVSPKDKEKKVPLPQHLKGHFLDKQITVVEYHGIAPGTERDIFQRVQMGMPLTAAEKLQAISSPWAQWIVQLESKHITHEEGLADKLAWDTKRGRDFQNVAHMVFCCDGLDEETLPTAQKMEKWMNRADNPSKQFQDDIDDTLRCLWLLATKSEYNEGFTKIPQRIAPVEFIFIGVLLYVLRREDYPVKAKAIYTLRRTIRQEFKDIRNNSDVGKAMWRHINSLRSRPHALLEPNQGKVPKSSKRKRNSGYDDEDDEEFRPKPMKAIGKPVKTRAKQSKT